MPKLSSLRQRLLALLFLGLALALLLSACRVYVRPGQVSVHGHVSFGIQLANIITNFEPDRGQGATYYTGDYIGFRIRTTSNGYITLTDINAVGRTSTFACNVYVQGGVTNVISTTTSGGRFQIAPPRGMDRVRALFTPSPLNGNACNAFRGRQGETIWTQSIVTNINPYPANARDISQTYFYIQ